MKTMTIRGLACHTLAQLNCLIHFLIINFLIVSSDGCYAVFFYFWFSASRIDSSLWIWTTCPWKNPNPFKSSISDHLELVREPSRYPTIEQPVDWLIRWFEVNVTRFVKLFFHYLFRIWSVQYGLASMNSEPQKKVAWVTFWLFREHYLLKNGLYIKNEK